MGSATLLLIIFIDIISRERVEPIKLIFFTNLMVAGVFVYFFVDPLTSNFLPVHR